MKLVSNTTADLLLLKQKLETNFVLGFDYESTSSHPHPDAPLHHDKVLITGYGMGFPDGDKTYVPLIHEDEESNAPYDLAMEILKSVLLNSEYEVWAHNAKYETMVSTASEIDAVCKFRCSQVAAWLLNLGLGGKAGLKLKPLVAKYMNYTMTTLEDVLGTMDVRTHEIHPDKMGPYCADDSYWCLAFGLWMKERLEQQQLWYTFTALECPFIEVLSYMEGCGNLIDSVRITEIEHKLREEEDALADEFLELVGVGVGQNQRVAEEMYFKKEWWPIYPGIKVGKKEFEGQKIPSVGAGTREALFNWVHKGTDAHRALELKERHAVVSKLRSTYTHSLVNFAALYVDNRIHAGFHQTGTDTGRLSSSKPNLQNVPSKGEGVVIRDAFIAEDGWIICVCDYSGADLVMMAHLSRDERMIGVYVNRRDLHQETADSCGVTRPIGKVCNLGIIYEMTHYTLAKNIGSSNGVAEITWKNWHSTYPGVGRYQKKMHAYARKHGFVKTITGRRRYLPDINSSTKYKRLFAQRAASNTPDQGSVSDVIKIAMRNLYFEWKSRGILYDYRTGQGDTRIINQVHDEIVCEFKEGVAEERMADVRRHMETAVKLRAPMRAGPGIGKTWLEAKKDADVREKAEKQLVKMHSNFGSIIFDKSPWELGVLPLGEKI